MMLIRRNLFNRLISLMLVVSILLMTVGCSNAPPTPTISDANPQTVTEGIEVENIITENELHEFITTEVYLTELVVVEDKIVELLLNEEEIEEVTYCSTIYIPQENIEEFSENSQTSKLFGEGVNIKAVLSKVAIGTGVILTTTVLKKVGADKPIASIVAAAASESLKGAAIGGGIGTVFGAFTGASNEIDESGKISAIAGFALATVGVILSIVSLVGAIPSGGTSSFGAAEGIHLAFAGIRLLLAGVGEGFAARDTVKAFTSTEATEIDWNNIDWEQVGVSAAEKAISNGTDGYMWGAIYGAVDGAEEAYYQKYCTPYTKYKNRLKKVPKEGDKGHWSGDPGESKFILNEPIKLPDGTTITKVKYQNAVPDFSPYAKAQVNIPQMTNKRLGKGGNYEQADQALAEFWSKTKYNNKKNWTSADVREFRENYPCKLTWHEMSNMKSMQLVPYDVNATFTHYGGVAEYNAMIGEKGEADFD